MKKYMLTFFGGNMALRYDNLGKAEKETREKHSAAWGEWMSKLMKTEHLEMGYPLESDGKRIDAVRTQAYHFPDTTAEIAQSSPIIKNGGYILARPCGEMK
jgi:hypothetical protein